MLIKVLVDIVLADWFYLSYDMGKGDMHIEYAPN